MFLLAWVYLFSPLHSVHTLHTHTVTHTHTAPYLFFFPSRQFISERLCSVFDHRVGGVGIASDAVKSVNAGKSYRLHFDLPLLAHFKSANEMILPPLNMASFIAAILHKQMCSLWNKAD